MKDDREAWELLLNSLQNVECERRRDELTRLGVACALLGFELVRAMARANRNRERIATRLLRELNDFLRLGVVRLFRRDFILNTRENAELSLNCDVVLVSVGNNLLRELDILFERKRTAVNHDRAEARINAALASLKAVTVVEVKDDLGLLATEFLSIRDGTLSHVAQNRGVSVLTRTLRNLHNDGRLRLDCRLNNRLHLLHCIEVERRDRITALDGLCEHLLGID